jgi:hypothetical protein
VLNLIAEIERLKGRVLGHHPRVPTGRVKPVTGDSPSFDVGGRRYLLRRGSRRVVDHGVFRGVEDDADAPGGGGVPPAPVKKTRSPPSCRGRSHLPLPAPRPPWPGPRPRGAAVRLSGSRIRRWHSGVAAGRSAAAHERSARLAARIRQLENRLSDLLGEQEHQDGKAEYPACRQVDDLEQHPAS